MGSKKRVLNTKRTKIETRKKQQQAAKNDVNQFELKINKVKHHILGRKVAKNEQGKPLLNRSRAVHKREKTLLKEYKNKNKVRGFQDLRDRNIGNVIAAKYKEIQFNESEDIVELTHKGKPLDECIDDRLSSDDEDIDLFNRENFIETTHFGGGREGAPRSTKQILEDIRDEKASKKLEKEEVIAMTSKLDQEWSNIRSLVRFQSSSQASQPDTNNVAGGDDYDALFTQLTFDHDKPSPQKVTKAKQIDEGLTSTNPDTVFKAKLSLIETCDDIEVIIKHLRETLNSLVSRVTSKSLEILKDKLVEMSGSKLQFTPQEICILFISSYFKELQVLAHMIMMKALNKLKYSNYHQVATSIFFLNMLLKNNIKQFYPELFVHLQNLLDLCMPSGPIRLKLFYRLDHKAEVILSVAKFASANLVSDNKMNVTFTNLFEGTFSDIEGDEDELSIAYNLALQIATLATNVYSHFADTSAVYKLVRPAIDRIKTLLESPLPLELKSRYETFLAKADKTDNVLIVNQARPKPFILPMLEPRIEENFTGKNRVDDKRKLARQYKQEFKGAQREIRKDAIFLRNTFLKEIQQKDRKRKQKVKELLRDLSVQQGLYKKKK